MAGGSCLCICSSCGPCNGGRDCSIPGNSCAWPGDAPTEQGRAARELQQAPQPAKAPCRRELHSTMEEKWGRVF